jgi:hypothetical protein
MLNAQPEILKSMICERVAASSVVSRTDHEKMAPAFNGAVRLSRQARFQSINCKWNRWHE